jgi:ubiquinone/menaquinone biosynthesis C-methylase UbiE
MGRHGDSEARRSESSEGNTVSIDFTPTIRRFTGFAGTYDRHRPAPPEELAAVLGLLRGVGSGEPDLVIDLGCGTGLSARYWARHAARVIGVDPSPDMLTRAAATTAEPNVVYCAGFGHATGLPDACADIVTCAQSFHWMEPGSTLAEVARLLRPGGVFAAYDYDFIPITQSWEADLAFRAFDERVDVLEAERHLSDEVPKWPKHGHLARVRESGRFRYTREILLHHMEVGDAARLEGLARSQGSVQTLLKAGASEEEIGLSRLRADAERLLGGDPRPWYWCFRVRAAVK